LDEFLAGDSSSFYIPESEVGFGWNAIVPGKVHLLLESLDYG
jgi:hypothetical protein